jgi:toxin YhaV
VVVNGWRLFTHPLFAQQFERLVAQVEALAAKDPTNYKEFRQGNTLGEDNRHWFRAKFHERYRLFYRFSSQDKVIIYAWVNDENSLRKAGAKTDPYTLFRNMLASGNPPSNISQLLGTSKEIPETRTDASLKLSSSEGKKTKKELPQRKK